MKTNRGNWLQTYTGKRFYPLDPRPEDVDIRDIAHALGCIPRFGGHTLVPYTVAEHSVFVSRICPPELAFYGLMHDATEAYLGDMVRPLKNDLPKFRQIEGLVWEAICEKFLIDPHCPEIIKHWDNIALVTERRDLMRHTPFFWCPTLEALTPHKHKIVPISVSARHCLDPAYQTPEELFMARFWELSPDTMPLPPIPNYLYKHHERTNTRPSSSTKSQARK